MSAVSDLIFRNARILDGTGRPGFEADVAVAGDRVVSVGKTVDAGGARVIDVSGLILCPGFIDTHAHSEFTLLAEPGAEGKIHQGVTTEINGNCGLSAGPLLGVYADRRKADLEEVGVRDRWSSLAEYERLLMSRRPAINSATLVGHGNLRGAVVGYEAREARPAELDEMARMLDEAMGWGALGLSTGLVYPPGIYAGAAELVHLSRVVSGYGGLYASHMRSESDELIEAVEEVITIGRQAGVPVHISHLKTALRRNWPKLDRVLALITEAREEGLRVTADRYPYVAAATDLDTRLPGWVFEGGPKAELERLKTPDVLKRIRAEMREEIAEESYWEGVVVSGMTGGLSWMEGLDLRTIAARLGRDPFDAFIGILVGSELRAGGIFFWMCEENLQRILSFPGVMVGSDASAKGFTGITAKGRPHPRSYGTMPRYLGRYVREKGGMGLEDAVHRMTGLPARVFGLPGRGVVEPGAFADLVVLDPEKIADRATFAEPFQKPEGIAYVMVNGELVVEHGERTGRRPGRLIKRNKS